MDNNQTRDVLRAARIKRTAEIVGVSTRYVNYVLEGDRDSEDVFSVFMELQEGENRLVKAVKELLPFDKPYKSATQDQRNSNSSARNQKIA